MAWAGAGTGVEEGRLTGKGVEVETGIEEGRVTWTGVEVGAGAGTGSGTVLEEMSGV